MKESEHIIEEDILRDSLLYLLKTKTFGEHQRYYIEVPMAKLYITWNKTKKFIHICRKHNVSYNDRQDIIMSLYVNMEGGASLHLKQKLETIQSYILEDFLKDIIRAGKMLEIVNKGF